MAISVDKFVDVSADSDDHEVVRPFDVERLDFVQRHDFCSFRSTFCSSCLVSDRKTTPITPDYLVTN